MAERPLLIKGGRIVDPSQGIDGRGDILVAHGRIAGIYRNGLQAEPAAGWDVVDAADLVVTPGLVDLHCHLREPGYEEKETIATGTLAAARGGFTTVCCMPNTDPPLDSVAAVEYVVERVRREASVRVLPIGCVTRGREGKQLVDMVDLARAGVVGFSDDGDPVADAHLMQQALSYSRLTGLPVMDHCQDRGLSRGGVVHEGWVSSRLGLRGIPAAAEEMMVARDIALAEATGGHLHLCHVSTAGSVGLLRQAKARGVPVTAEATPHHLTLTEAWVLGERADGAFSRELLYDTNTKVNPPLRSRADVEAVRSALREGVIDCVATDHAPHALLDKLCTYDDAAFGISGLETALAVLMGLVHEGVLTLGEMVHRITAAPAGVLNRPLGTLQEGALADMALIDPGREWVVEPERFASRGRNTPLQGVTLKGRVVATFVDGAMVHDELMEASKS